MKKKNKTINQSKFVSKSIKRKKYAIKTKKLKNVHLYAK